MSLVADYQVHSTVTKAFQRVFAPRARDHAGSRASPASPYGWKEDCSLSSTHRMVRFGSSVPGKAHGNIAGGSLKNRFMSANFESDLHRNGTPGWNVKYRRCQWEIRAIENFVAIVEQ